MIDEGETSVDKIKAAIRAEIESEPLAKVDYVEIVDYDDLSDIEVVKAPMLAAVAVYIGKTRLIDNFIIE